MLAIDTINAEVFDSLDYEICRAFTIELANDLWDMGETWQASRFYVLAYFAASGDIVDILEITDSEECGEGAFDVHFVLDGRQELFSVWMEPQIQSVYGEW